jgi:hypothetical protein
MLQKYHQLEHFNDIFFANNKSDIEKNDIRLCIFTANKIDGPKIATDCHQNCGLKNDSRLCIFTTSKLCLKKLQQIVHFYSQQN